jgi:hypothetical protein
MSEVSPVPVVCLKVIVPPALFGGYPVTVAVQVLDEPTLTVEGAHPTETLLGDWFTVTEPPPTLLAKVVSPEYVAPIMWGEPLARVGV